MIFNEYEKYHLHDYIDKKERHTLNKRLIIRYKQQKLRSQQM